MSDRARYQLWLARFLGVVLFALLIVTVFLLYKGPRRIPFANDPRFVTTTPPVIGSPNPSLFERAGLAVFKPIQSLQGPRPLNFSFAACPTNKCSIHGLLNQCMAVTGVRYVIAKDVAAGTVEFGHSVALNGGQWVSAFSDTLLHGQIEWWDPKAQVFHHEGLLLLTNDPKTVLVIPRAMAADLQSSKAKATEAVTK